MVENFEMLINHKYKIIEKIGSGSFGSIYKGENMRTHETVAIKVEPISNVTKLLKNESIIYQYLQNSKGIPQVKWFGKDKDNYYMVINLLGQSLENLKSKINNFSLRLTLQIGIQVIKLLRTIHDKGLVHRDIKPDNFLFGLNDQRTRLYMIDFGFCKTYLHDDKHIKLKKTSGLTGTPTYASVNTHRFLEQSRRDDLESVGYMLMYLCLGKLEWQNIGFNEEKNNVICSMKERILTNEKIQNNCKIPSVIIEYLTYVKELKFEDTPNYLFLIDLMKREIT